MNLLQNTAVDDYTSVTFFIYLKYLLANFYGPV